MPFLMLATSSGTYYPRPTANYRTVITPHMPEQGKRVSPSRPDNLPGLAIPPNPPLTGKVDFGNPMGSGVDGVGERQGLGPQCRRACLVPIRKAGQRGKQTTITIIIIKPPCHSHQQIKRALRRPNGGGCASGLRWAHVRPAGTPWAS